MKTITQFIIILCFGFGLPIIMLASFEIDTSVVKQVVDNSCNENNLCEAELGETIYTCPHDCHTGNIQPAILQQVAQLPPIEIFNLNISIANRQVIILWETNKPTISILVLSDGRGEIQGEFEGKLYVNKHSVKIGGLNLAGEEYYFKIFAKGAFGDNNYDNVDLFALVPFETGDNLSEIQAIGKTEKKLKQELEQFGAGYEIIKADNQKSLELKNKIIASALKEVVKSSQENDFDSASNFGKRVKERLYKMRILGEHSWSSFVAEYKFLIAILSGIVFFLII